jgi:hypothetical protein
MLNKILEIKQKFIFIKSETIVENRILAIKQKFYL